MVTHGPWTYEVANDLILIGPKDRVSGRIECVVATIEHDERRLENAKVLAMAWELYQKELANGN